MEAERGFKDRFLEHEAFRKEIVKTDLNGHTIIDLTSLGDEFHWIVAPGVCGIVFHRSGGWITVKLTDKQYDKLLL